MKKKIKLGENFSSFLIPLVDYNTETGPYGDQDLISYKGSNCWIKHTNWITYEVILVSNQPQNAIEYEIENLCWLW